MIKDLPGYDEALALGYHLTSYSNNRSSADYSKDSLVLVMTDKGKATLWACIGAVELEVKSFSFPNENFHLFEKNMNSILLAYQEYLERLDGIF